MAQFEEILKAWNKGKIRGAQTRLADKLGLAPNTVSQWISGKSFPSADVQSKLAKELGITVDVLLSSFGGSGPILDVVREPRHAYAPDATALILGRLEQLTIQIALLQKDMKKIDDLETRVARVEETGREKKTASKRAVER